MDNIIENCYLIREWKDFETDQDIDNELGILLGEITRELNFINQTLRIYENGIQNRP
jgi:hypothetical protein